LLSEWLGSYGSGLVGSGALLVGDKLYGYRGGLLSQVEAVGWLPVVRVGCGLRQGVGDKARVRALERLGEYGWALGERYRVEQVFGSVKGVYGSYVGCRRWKYARVQVWGMLVLWNLVQWLRVGGGAGNFWCVSLVFWVDGAQGKGILEHPHLAGHNGTYQIQVTVRYVTGPIPFHYGVYEETATMTLTMSNLVLVDSREEPYFVWKPLEVAPPPEPLNMLNVPEDPIAVGPTVPFSVQIQHAQSGVCTLRLEIFTSDNNEVPILVKEFTNVPRPGVWQWEWDGRLADGSTAPRGIYLYRLSAEA
jgi:hypothetical protein